MKTAFLNSICHEIRTPLNSIAGFSELIFDESLDTATRQEFRQLIQKQFYRVSFLMDNMLELSQLSARTASSCGVYRRIRTMC